MALTLSEENRVAGPRRLNRLIRIRGHMTEDVAWSAFCFVS